MARGVRMKLSKSRVRFKAETVKVALTSTVGGSVRTQRHRTFFDFIVQHLKRRPSSIKGIAETLKLSESHL
jgi:hypothetical protein